MMTNTALLGLRAGTVLTVKSNIMKGQYGRVICLWCPTHDTVDVPVLSLYMLLLKQRSRHFRCTVCLTHFVCFECDQG